MVGPLEGPQLNALPLIKHERPRIISGAFFVNRSVFGLCIRPVHARCTGCVRIVYALCGYLCGYMLLNFIHLQICVTIRIAAHTRICYILIPTPFETRGQKCTLRW